MPSLAAPSATEPTDASALPRAAVAAAWACRVICARCMRCSWSGPARRIAPYPAWTQLSHPTTLVMPAVSTTTSPLLHGIRDLFVGMLAYAVMLIVLTLFVMATDHVRFRWYEHEREKVARHHHHHHQRIRKEFASPTTSTSEVAPSPPAPAPAPVAFQTNVFTAAAAPAATPAPEAPVPAPAAVPKHLTTHHKTNSCAEEPIPC
ncbi:uncharacterized protein LOC62_05G007142 [Vanrija pseudolonga]|uniref:Uncharacterized protein n=1 Tax=Vanrija pseudolonga TaxID=143232 RepID=A0AAF1BK68_9TREE|nr:hypothetical protein LOC62_05G007142 [Vanrija pseudolonga]